MTHQDRGGSRPLVGTGMTGIEDRKNSAGVPSCFIMLAPGDASSCLPCGCQIRAPKLSLDDPTTTVFLCDTHRRGGDLLTCLARMLEVRDGEASPAARKAAAALIEEITGRAAPDGPAPFFDIHEDHCSAEMTKRDCGCSLAMSGGFVTVRLCDMHRLAKELLAALEQLSFVSSIILAEMRASDQPLRRKPSLIIANAVDDFDKALRAAISVSVRAAPSSNTCASEASASVISQAFGAGACGLEAATGPGPSTTADPDLSPAAS